MLRFAALSLVVLAAGCAIPRSSEGAVSPGSGSVEAPAATAEPEIKTATWGERYTWPDGLAVEVSTPKPCKPGEYAMPQKGERAVKVTIRVTNGTKEPFNTVVLSVGNDAQFEGKKAELVFDSSGECGGGLDSATVLPGKTFEMSQAFAVGAQPGELQVALQPNFGAAKAIFVGQA